MIADAAGNLYGTTYYGGAHGEGTVFELSPCRAVAGPKRCCTASSEEARTGLIPTAAWSSIAPATFTARPGSGGTYRRGTVFELSPTGGGIWTEQVLHSFVGYPTDGATPAAGLIFSAAGNLYGTTGGGGTGVACGTGGCGTVFELMPTAGGGWTETVLHSFNWNGTDGFYPEAGLIFDGAGNLYGTTEYGGAYNYGTVFELTPSGGGRWTEKVVHSFNNNGSDGAEPFDALVLDSVGKLYGTTSLGGVNNAGVGVRVVAQWRRGLDRS